MDARSRWRLVRIAATFAALSFAWLLFSGELSLPYLTAGLLCALLIAAATYDVFIEEHEAARSALLPRFVPALLFPFTLIAAMYSASFRVLASVVTGRISPRVVHFRSRMRSDLARVVLAEAITFTPGTITIELDEDHFVVHWLNSTTSHSTRAGAEVKGDLERAIGRIWI